MGTALIIKNADFSANGMSTEFFQRFSVGQQSTVYTANGTLNQTRINDVLSTPFTTAGTYYVKIEFTNDSAAKAFADGGGKFNFLVNHGVNYVTIKNGMLLGQIYEIQVTTSDIIGATSLIVQGDAAYSPAIDQSGDGTFTITFYKKVSS